MPKIFKLKIYSTASEIETSHYSKHEITDCHTLSRVFSFHVTENIGLSFHIKKTKNRQIVLWTAFLMLSL